jgi:hypothetical protein
VGLHCVRLESISPGFGPGLHFVQRKFIAPAYLQMREVMDAL